MAAADLAQIADVDIDSDGVFKYVLIRVHSAPPSEAGESKEIVRGYKWAEYHGEGGAGERFRGGPGGGASRLGGGAEGERRSCAGSDPELAQGSQGPGGQRAAGARPCLLAPALLPGCTSSSLSWRPSLEELLSRGRSCSEPECPVPWPPGGRGRC
ncbi:14 kDa phosphohistidine phosphatase isoform X1 [Meles meles]|uniref:14 kDa phosphohistidine phosphatase isoform X1 n=1 Tax=Meles meles TaxID=9662 RepID=UPI001E69BF6C|nr:14 kDa phosphohistidine phosphatase isoform X1 [Meles meles]